MPQEKPLVRIAPNNPVFDLPVIVGIQEGLFDRAGLDVRFTGTYADREKDRVESPVMWTPPPPPPPQRASAEAEKADTAIKTAQKVVAIFSIALLPYSWLESCISDTTKIILPRLNNVEFNISCACELFAGVN